MKDLLPVVLLVAVALLGYDDYRNRQDLAAARETIAKLESAARERSPEPGYGAPPPHPPQGNWLQQRLQQPNPLNEPPVQSGGGGGGGRGPGGGPGGGGRGGPPR